VRNPIFTSGDAVLLARGMAGTAPGIHSMLNNVQFALAKIILPC
jgi:hypothetical protein